MIAPIWKARISFLLVQRNWERQPSDWEVRQWLPGCKWGWAPWVSLWQHRGLSSCHPAFLVSFSAMEGEWKCQGFSRSFWKACWKANSCSRSAEVHNNLEMSSHTSMNIFIFAELSPPRPPKERNTVSWSAPILTMYWGCLNSRIRCIPLNIWSRTTSGVVLDFFSMVCNTKKLSCFLCGKVHVYWSKFSFFGLTY